MENTVTAPFLSRVKSWQLVALGFSGWCTFYSIALVAGSAFAGHIQGGCFAASMTLAGVESRRFRRIEAPANTLSWIQSMPTEELNRTLAQVLEQQEFYVESTSTAEKEMGFGVRAVKSGRTIVFETDGWHEPIITLAHLEATEKNRQKVFADIAYVVSLGVPDVEAKAFANSHPIRFLGRSDLLAKFSAEQMATPKTFTA